MKNLSYGALPFFASLLVRDFYSIKLDHLLPLFLYNFALVKYIHSIAHTYEL